MFKTLLFIGLGGFIGSTSRFIISKFVQGAVFTSFPLGTFVVNILGCYILGFIYSIMERGEFISSDLRLFLTVGICGGFTTFSTFTVENAALLRDGNYLQFSIYAAGSLFAGLLALYLGNITLKLF